MNLFWVVGVALIAVISMRFLSRYAPEYAQFLPLIAAVLLLLALLPRVGDALSAVQNLGLQSGIEDNSLGLIFRGLGIALITRFAAGICIDCGQKTLGDTVEYCGQIAIVSLALPLISDLAQRIGDGGF